MTEEKLNDVIVESKRLNDPEAEERAIAALAEYLYTSLHKFKLKSVSDDNRGDFILWMYPRFRGIIRNFDPARASFRTYLYSIVTLSYQTFLRTQFLHVAQQKAYETEEITRILSIETEKNNLQRWGESVAESPALYKKAIFSEETTKKKVVLFRKILLLALKSGSCLDEATIDNVSALTGYSTAYIHEKIHCLRRECKTKYDKLHRDREQQNSLYIRAQRCLQEMKMLDNESARYVEIEQEYRYCVKRLNKIRKNSARRIYTPSNRQLASVLGISRGTIDSTLASIRKRRYPDVS